MKSLLSQRVRNTNLLQRVKTAEELIPLFRDGQWLGWSGFTGVGYPKMIPTALADHVEKNNLQGKMRFNLFVGASSGAETEDRWARLNMIDRRSPHQVGKNIQDGINSGRIRFADKHLSMFPQDLVMVSTQRTNPAVIICWILSLWRQRQSQKREILFQVPLLVPVQN
jgi:acetyl-CoA hydrolase